jgi:prepilin-type N-terminal cleavage/methylation domain-containing protein
MSRPTILEGQSTEDSKNSESVDRGFSLIEMMVVIAILGIILAIAIPSLLRARQTANSASAVSSLRTINTAEHLYENRYGGYGTLTLLLPEGTLDSNLQSGVKSGYSFTVNVSADLKHFQCNGDPLEIEAILPHYFVDESAVIRVATGVPADVNSSPIQ